MKKLMIAVAAVAMAATVNAASSMSWTLFGVKQGAVKDTPAATGIAYIFAGAKDSYNVATIVSAIQEAYAAEATTAGSFADYFDNAIYGPFTGADFKQTTAGTYSTKTGSGITAPDPVGAGKIDGGTTYDFYAVVFDTAADLDSVTDTTKFYVSNVKQTKANGSSATSVGFGTQATASGNKDNWYAVAPEPTSGLLMLLGMAGLALRRRRA